jgi:hypothetical protein
MDKRYLDGMRAKRLMKFGPCIEETGLNKKRRPVSFDDVVRKIDETIKIARSKESFTIVTVCFRVGYPISKKIKSRVELKYLANWDKVVWDNYSVRLIMSNKSYFYKVTS